MVMNSRVLLQIAPLILMALRCLAAEECSNDEPSFVQLGRKLLSKRGERGRCLGNDVRCSGSSRSECLEMSQEGADCKFLPLPPHLNLRVNGPDSKYVIMTDAGSSKTLVNIFSYDSSGILVQESPEPSIKISALTSYLGKPEALKKDFTSLIINSTDAICALQPDRSTCHTVLHATPFYMFATAGMRGLSPEDQDSIYKVCLSVLRDRSMSPYQVEDENVRTMAGEEEASFTLLTVNYENADCDYNMKCPGVGITGQLEMGGESTQVSFQPVSEIDVLGNSFIINNQSDRLGLYSISYMEYGQNGASALAQEMVAEQAPDSDTVDYPCWLKGFKNISMVFAGTAREKNITFVGTGEFVACKELTKAILHLDYMCPLPPCSIEGEYMPNPKPKGQKFLGLSGFRFAFYNYGMPLSGSGSTPADLDAENQKFCALTYDEMKEDPKYDPKYVYNQCFLGNYVYNVLTEALHFTNDSEQVSYDGDASWPLGAVLFEVMFV
mmetsp:Transcript_49594/g.106172  ORF Transcript_49594/g.106172 Transcript_49594/m.106172 type:complete len:497 (+) Transcript_49594:85-1575(+)